jgi:dTDP-4-dehydrorhamnose reductase
MILLIGGSGYVGKTFQTFLSERNIPYSNVSRSEVDYYDKAQLAQLIKETKTTFLINAAGYTGKPNVDACEDHKTDTLLGNAILPGVIREVCEDLKLTWGHVSSGCIYTGRRSDGNGFTETDPPNFSFRTNNCSFYSGTKALGEEVLEGAENCYIWRLRIPFNHIDSPRNYLSKLLTYEYLLEAENSISHLDDFVAACIATWKNKIPSGIYNITNPGSVTTKQVVELLQQHLTPERSFKFFENEDEFMQKAARTPRSNCVLDSSKIIQAGITLRPAEEAIIHSLNNWSANQN